MQFEWDDAKNRENLRKHGISFADAVAVFAGPMLAAIDDRYEYGEDRWIGIGLLDDLPIVIVWTEPAERVTRIISVRKANRQERDQYEQYLWDRF